MALDAAESRQVAHDAIDALVGREQRARVSGGGDADKALRLAIHVEARVTLQVAQHVASEVNYMCLRSLRRRRGAERVELCEAVVALIREHRRRFSVHQVTRALAQAVALIKSARGHVACGVAREVAPLPGARSKLPGATAWREVEAARRARAELDEAVAEEVAAATRLLQPSLLHRGAPNRLNVSIHVRV